MVTSGAHPARARTANEAEPAIGFWRGVRMEWFCGLVIGVLGTVVLVALIRRPTAVPRPSRPFRYCPACGEETKERDEYCPQCDLDLDGRLARELHRVRVAEREIRTLLDRAQIDRETAETVLDQLETRARSLQGLPAGKHGTRSRAKPLARPVRAAPPPVAPSPESPGPVAPADAVEVVPAANVGAALSEAPAEPAAPSSVPVPGRKPHRETPEPLEPAEPPSPPTPPEAPGGRVPRRAQHPLG